VPTDRRSNPRHKTEDRRVVSRSAQPSADEVCPSARPAEAAVAALAVPDTRARPCTAGYGRHSGRVGRRRTFGQLSRVGQHYARAYADRPSRDRYACPDLSEVVIPAGYRPVLDASAARSLPDVLPEVTAALYENSRATRLAVWAALVEHLHPDTGLIVASHAQIGERAGVHRGRRVPRSTAGNHVRALVDAGLLHVALHGASKEALGAERDRAPVYVILTPDVDDQADVAGVQLPPDPAKIIDSPVDELGHLPEGSAPTRMGDITHPRKNEKKPRSKALSEPATPARRASPERFAPRGAAERWICVAWLAAVMGWRPHKRTYGELLKIIGPFFTAGWSPKAILYAWRIQPSGEPWPGPLPEPHQRDRRDPIRIRNLWAVLTARLAAWRDPLGQPVAPPIESERPRRGRPRKPPAPRPASAPPPRAGTVDTALTGLRARLAGERAERDAEQARREARRAAAAAAAAESALGHTEPTAVDHDQAEQLPPAPSDRSALIRRQALIRRHVDRGAKP
jgi:hypothetical protein